MTSTGAPAHQPANHFNIAVTSIHSQDDGNIVFRTIEGTTLVLPHANQNRLTCGFLTKAAQEGITFIASFDPLLTTAQTVRDMRLAL